MRKPTLSPTKITTYLTCRAKYYWAYISPLGRKYQQPNPTMALGANLHRVLQAFHELGGAERLNPHQVEQMLESLWSEQGFASSEQSKAHKQIGHTLMHNYYHQQAEQPSEARLLFTERMLRRDLGAFVLIGRVDRVDEYPDGTLEIIDYKSGRTQVSEEQVTNDLALHCYALLVETLYPERPLRIALYALQISEKASVPVSPETLREFQEMLTLLGTQILNDTFETLEPEPIPHCAVCQFLPLCQRFYFGAGKQEA